MIIQADLVAKLDTFFNVTAFDEAAERESFPVGYDLILQRFTAPGFWESSWNGLFLSNTATVERVYCVVFPSQSVLDTIIAKEVERGAPGAMIFCHHLADYQETGPGMVYTTEAQLEELKEHSISYYLCHAPLDCHPEISTSTAFANALKLKDQTRFAPYYGGQSGVIGKINAPNPPGFVGEFARKVCDTLGLPNLRYSALRNNGRVIQQVGVVAGLGGSPEYMQEAITAGCDTFVTGEWWLFGPGDWRTRRREKMHEFLISADLNIIGTSHYASEMLVMRDQMVSWIRENIPTVEPVFIPQEDPFR